MCSFLDSVDLCKGLSGPFSWWNANKRNKIKLGSHPLDQVHAQESILGEETNFSKVKREK